ncbi:MAG TPA: carboxylating nicotinate-nucleotide diphosphorylase [Planctomycetota bacterium]|nr:carboxylating nicotinate-nucleotide diphosphorylase [Planctomycetota bacterium]
MLTGFDLDVGAARAAVKRALEEDVGSGDVTTDALVPADAVATGAFVAREGGVLAGLEVAALAFHEASRGIELQALVEDGERFPAGAKLATVRGPARGLLVGERVALNFLQRLSGVATIARRFVEAVEGTGAKIYDTRKTTPGLRALEKYAVRAGGAQNHRMGLFHEGLVKDNHLAVLARRAGVSADEVDLKAAVAAIRARRPGVFVEVEATTERGVLRALEAEPDAILLDNMSPALLKQCVALVRGRARPGARRVILEASGGVKLETVRAIAESGVDRVSVGALTHSARALDISLELEF